MPVWEDSTELELFIRQNGLSLREARQHMHLFRHYLGSIGPALSQTTADRRRYDLPLAKLWPDNALRIMGRVQEHAHNEPPYVYGVVREICWAIQDIERVLDVAISCASCDDDDFKLKATKFDNAIRLTKQDCDEVLSTLDDLIKHDPRPIDIDD